MDEIGHMTEVALFKEPNTNIALQKIEFVDYRPVNQLTGEVVEFNVPGTSTQYIDLKSTRLYVKVKVVKGDGTPIHGDNKAILTNMALQSLWSQVDVSLQQQLVTKIGANYPYKCMFDLLLEDELDPDDAELQAQLYFKETGKLHNADPLTAGNSSLDTRWELTAADSVDLAGPLYVDMMQQPRYLLNGVPVNIKLWPSRDPFRLISPDVSPNYKVVLMDAFLRMGMVTMNPDVIMAHASTLEKEKAMYPIRRSVIKTYTISEGSFNFNVDDIFQGEVPSSLAFGIVSSAAYNGNYGKNPYNFKHYDLNFACFYVNGQATPKKALQPNFEEESYIEAYLSLFPPRRNSCHTHGQIIKRIDYNKGYTLYLFTVSDDRLEDEVPVERKGHTRLELRFAKGLTESAMVILYAKFPGKIQIDEARRVIV